VFINIILALLFSIPAINFFTHGTHVTVAHSMGTTIGINTTILLASLFFILSQLGIKKILFSKLKKTFYAYNIFLLFFFIALLYAGAIRGNWMYFNKDTLFSEMQNSLYYVYVAFFIFGLGLLVAIVNFVWVLLKLFIKMIRK
jgi:nitric oxide reductase subunit B